MLEPFAALIDWNFAVVAGGALLAGLVRGFAGFGAAMVMMPIASAVYGPTIGIVVLFMADLAASVPLFASQVKRCSWREVGTLFAGAAVTLPIGLFLLAALDPTLVRWVISLFILAAVVALAAGWRYHRKPHAAATVAVGAASGFSGGLVGVSGPPVILFWLAGQSDAQRVRANTIVYFGLTTVWSVVGFWINDLWAAEPVRLGLMAMPMFAIGVLAGALTFGRVQRHPRGERGYRLLAYGICFVVAVSTVPIW